jgi:hypothetical protein
MGMAGGARGLAGTAGSAAASGGQGRGPGAAFLQQAAQAGYFRLAGEPRYAQAAFNLYSDLLSANPDMMQDLAQHFQQGGTWMLQAGNSGGPKSANQGNSFSTVGQPNAQTYIDFGDAGFGMYDVAAHEFGHGIDGHQHTPTLFAETAQRARRAAALARGA